MPRRNLLSKLHQILIDLHDVARETNDPVVSKHLRDIAHMVNDIIHQLKRLFP
jgi:hypothetical protein